jgi:ribosomal protein S17
MQTQAKISEIQSEKKEINPQKTPLREPRTKFFSRSRCFNKKEFELKLVEAIKLIAQNKSTVAREVFNILQSKQVIIRSFYELKEEHFLYIKEQLINKENHDLLQYFPPNKKAVELIESALTGIYFYKNVIYIQCTLNLYKMAKAIIHEVTHYINHSLYKKEMKTKTRLVARYLDEMRSHSAELLFKKNGDDITDEDKQKISEKIKDGRYKEFTEIGNKKIRVR